ncbi:MAG: hypothetical protein MSG64_11450 [Pyrinomonadaceae bacterium MAG19_C2-C3]|nr:hypothetical protein [Pyrinomonadaceae bacterium MAG19_C2-C3]
MITIPEVCMAEKTRQKKDGERTDKKNERRREAESDPALKADLSEGDENRSELTDEERAAQSTQTSKAMRE